MEGAKQGHDSIGPGINGESQSGIDIGYYGNGISGCFSYRRLTDDTNEGGQSGDAVGADIDAVGANFIYSPSRHPEPSTMLLYGSGLIGQAGYGRREFLTK